MVDSIIAALEAQGIRVYVQGGRLFTSTPQGKAVPAALGARIREHREELIRVVETRQARAAAKEEALTVAVADLAPRLAAFRAAAWNVNAIPYLFLPWAPVTEGLCLSCGELLPYQDKDGCAWCRCLPCLVAARIVREEREWPYPVDSVIGRVMREHALGYAAAYKRLMGHKPSKRVMARWAPVEAMAAQHMRRWRQWGRSRA